MMMTLLLSSKWWLFVGENEAKDGGVELKKAGFKFDKAYTSYLRRAIKTCWLVLEQVRILSSVFCGYGFE